VAIGMCQSLFFKKIQERKYTMSMRPTYIKFETSRGWIYGSVDSTGNVTLDRDSEVILGNKYVYSHIKVIGEWVVVFLDDGHYGNPEYRFVECDLESINAPFPKKGGEL
jgi:hypothetical protein